MYQFLHDMIPTHAIPGVTKGQWRIVQLVACGYDNVTIAAILNVSKRYIDNELSMLFTKLRIPHGYSRRVYLCIVVFAAWYSERKESKWRVASVAGGPTAQ